MYFLDLSSPSSSGSRTPSPLEDSENTDQSINQSDASPLTTGKHFKVWTKNT